MASSGTAETATSISLRVRGLTKRYGERAALRDVTFGISPGELVAIIGPNGAGKTTLLSILAGIAPATSGSVEHGEGGVGWVPQASAIYAKLSVAENLRLFARLERAADPEQVVDRMLAQAGLEDRRDDEVSQLSGGNRQRVNIAVGLVGDPSILLLDEPSSSLDPRQRERLWAFIGGLTEHGTTVVYSTHNVQEAERYADRVLVLADGELLFAGTAPELERAVGVSGLDFEAVFVTFLREHGH